MKKKYFSPEMEEMDLDEPFVLTDSDVSTEEEPISSCPPEAGEA